VTVGVLGRIGAFIIGGALGAGIGAAIGVLAAPQSGDEFRDEVERRAERAKAAGLAAEERTVEELIRRFRAETNDPEALQGVQVQRREHAVRAAVNRNLVPGSLPPPGAAVS
jgi:gas vesicle protein